MGLFWRQRHTALASNEYYITTQTKPQNAKISLLCSRWSTIKKSERIFDEYSFLLARDRTFGLMKRENGNTYTVKDWMLCACINKTDYNTLHIEQSADGEHKFYINNQLVSQSKMSPTNLASIGFYCDAHTVLSIDYIRLAKRTL